MANPKKYQDVDLYALLGVEPDAAEKEIRKAYRKKALDCHPDKNPDNPKAAELFHELSSALELLTDEKARSIYDKYQQAKKAAQLRNDKLDIKRRKLKSDLEERERGGGSVKEDSRQFVNTEEQLRAEIDRLRKEGSRLLEEEQRLMREQIQKSSSTSTNQTNGNIPSHYRVKIKWKADKEDPTNGGYNADTLRRFLGKYGDITELVILTAKKGNAIVEFATKESAEMAVAYEKGDLKNTLKLSWIAGHQPQPAINGHRVVVPEQTNAPSTASNSDFESLVLRNLRQAEERKRLIEQLQREDAQAV